MLRWNNYLRSEFKTGGLDVRRFINLVLYKILSCSLSKKKQSVSIALLFSACGLVQTEYGYTMFVHRVFPSGKIEYIFFDGTVVEWKKE